MNKMKEDVKKLWVEALRSGKYVQGKNLLSSEGKYCCLGVLCELAREAGVINISEKRVEGWQPGTFKNVMVYDGEDVYLPARVQKWAGLDERNPHISDKEASFGYRTLAGINDEGKSFEVIANIIEKNF